MWRRLWENSKVKFVREMAEIYFGKNVGRSSAELAYFLILTFFPILICINAFIGVLNVDPESVLRGLEPFLPPSLLGVMAEYLNYITVNESAGLLAAGIFLTLFFASGAVRSLMNIMDDIYGRKGYGGILQVVVSVLFSILLLITIYVSIVVVMTGNWFFHLIERYLPLQFWDVTWDWQWIRFLLLFGMVFLLVLVVYLMAAPPGKPRAPVFLGALLASVALVGASIVFSFFIGMSSRYSLIYGSLASVIIMLLWLYLCGNVLILGNVFNCVRYRRKKAKKVQETLDKGKAD